MKIIIEDGPNSLIFTNEQLENDNYVDIILKSEERVIETTLPIDELVSAVLAFQNLKMQRLEQESLME